MHGRRNRQHVRLHRGPWGPQLDEVMVANSLGESRYRGLTLGIRKRFSDGLPARSQLRARQGRGRRLERARSVHRSQLQLLRSRAATRGRRIATSGTSSTLFGYFDAASGIQLNARVQARSAQPITPTRASLNGDDRGRNSERKDNEFFSFDWRLARPFRFGRTRTSSSRSSRCSTRSTTRTTSTR